MSSFLPNQDPDPTGRAETLTAARRTYQYNYNYVSPLAIVDRVPFHDEFSFHWISTVAERVLVGLANRADLEMHPQHRDYHLTHHGFLSRMLEAGTEMLSGIKHLITDALKFSGRIGALPERPQSLNDYADLFRRIGIPPVANNYQDDRVFAYMRIAGPNPVMLKRMTAREDRFPVSDADVRITLPNDSLDAAIAEGRAFLADYAMIDGAEEGDYPHGRKYVYAPIALFIVSPTTRELTPIAIQGKQTPGPDNPIFTPDDGYNWLIAKTIVEMADGNIHEADTHLGRTHLFMEPFVVTTFRQLAPNHPIARLLAPHFEGTLAINDGAWRHLIATKGAVDKLFSCSINASRGVAVQSVRNNAVVRSMLPDTFKARGVADANTLPNYPYRDDALLYWSAIREWVDDYVRLYYPTDVTVCQDAELQAWSRELASTDGGRISGMPNNGVFANVNEVVDVLTLVIYTCSVQHAAVNFPQYDLMSYVPNMPLALYAPAPTTKKGATEADYLAMLPPLDMAELQMELGFLLGTSHYTQLGDYREGHFADARVSGPLAKFTKRIHDAGKLIAERNAQRMPYQYLMPNGIPQSINI